jgi:hypothetical protein
VVVVTGPVRQQRSLPEIKRKEEFWGVSCRFSRERKHPNKLLHGLDSLAFLAEKKTPFFASTAGTRIR